MEKVSIQIEYLEAANYALIHNNIPVCQLFKITNETTDILQNVRVVCSGEFVKESSSEILAQIASKETIRLTTLEIALIPEKVLALTERMTTFFKIDVYANDEIVCSQDRKLDIMPYDQWLGTSIFPQTLASFVTPNHPLINEVIIKAASILKELTGSSSFAEYQTGNTNDVRAQIAAVFGALHEIGLVYRALPASFETLGQRVTLPNQVLETKLGNCIELSILFASVLECLGINCGIVLQRGHAYLAAWLVDDSCPYSICDDASFLEKKCSNGINEMLVIECTHVTQEDSSFDKAVKAAEKNLSDYDLFNMFIDIHRCRLERYLPLPQRINNNGKWEVVANEGIDHGDCVVDVKEHDRYDLSKLRESTKELTKFDIWERKLLDFSLRNSLLNMHMSRKAIQFMSFDIDQFENHLADGEEYCILAKPTTEVKLDSEDKLFNSKAFEALHGLVANDIEHHRLHSYHAEGETKDILKNIYRSARNAIEETGANSLFLAIGILRWYETPRSETPRYAPIVLVPVDLVYKKGSYFVRVRDEETTINVTLLEFLRQNYDINVNGLNPIPKDDHGVDVSLIFALLRDALNDQKRWNVQEECILGTFSFSKYLMWNDVHNHREMIIQNDIVSSLAEGRLTWTPTPVISDLKAIDSNLAPSELALPVAVDSSQMAAVIEGGKGHSFILYGPPGTGKSQTITNLIANALFQGERVLFVAEKMAALSVVQSRLAKIGLDPFCLEMHSNKVAKRHVLDQLGKALNVTHIVSPAEYENRAQKIFEQRKQLIDYINVLHNNECPDALSLHDSIVRYESFDAQPMAGFYLSESDDAKMTAMALLDVDDMLGTKLETVLKLVAHPSQHPLLGLRLNTDSLSSTPDQLSAKLLEAKEYLVQCSDKYDDLKSITDLREELMKRNTPELLSQDVHALYDEWCSIKAKWFLPRFFAKRKYVDKLKQFNKYIVSDEVDKLLDNLLIYKKKHDSIEKMRSIFRGLISKELPEDAMPKRDVLEDGIAKLGSWSQHTDGMRDWVQWCNYAEQLEAMGLKCVVTALEKNPLSAQEVHDSFLKALYKHKVQQKIAAAPMLKTFEGMLFDEQIKTYRKLTEEFQLLTQKELYARLAARIPRVTDSIDSSSEIGLLNRNISNGGRGMSLRDLLDQIPTLMPRLCPCMLMSPMSVAQYLDLSQDKFDLVVFDEASQMPTSEAVGAIARGKALIVVGDPKQMPPTSFFSSANVDEEEASIDDMESILEDCRTLEIPSLQLNWHYRSRHESLIAFSNKEYYDSQLITFPSVDDKSTKVRYVPVNGCYDKGGKRSNKAEAEAIVKEIERRLRDKELRRQSIGVIAFSVAQQNLIDDVLQDCLDAHKELREAADEMYEPIFVKNLENVQGDERDVILFSIGYGPSKDGTVSMNFGPLNNAGGERRLNVAVSRSRCEMIVYSTLKSSQIDLRRSKAKGVEGLKHFLEYAETQSLMEEGSTKSASTKSLIATKIAKAIEEKGYVTSVCVGRSHFKVDVAISKQSSPDVYCLGILLDGEGYRDTQTARDREIVQPSVLSGLKWNVMRVWSVDWFNNPDRVISRIIEAIESGPEPEKPVAKKQEFDISKEKVVEAETLAREYKEYTTSTSAALRAKDETLAKNIIEKEQPISFMQLCRRVCALREQARVTPTMQRDFSEIVRASFYSEPDRKGQVVWLNREASIGYQWYRPNSARDVVDIPMVEIKNVVLEAINEQFAIVTDNLSLVAAKKLGFTRRGANVDTALTEAIAQLKAEGRVEETDGKLKLIS